VIVKPPQNLALVRHDFGKFGTPIAKQALKRKGQVVAHLICHHAMPEYDEATARLERSV
jgi:hypothetical protein